MIDLHMHTTCSDGTDTVEKLIDNVIAAGITYFAITDHDTAKGCRKVLDSEELKQKISAANISFVCGIEFSCIYKGRKMHILAYDIDPHSKEILELEAKFKNLLKEKDLYRAEAIKEQGFVLSDESMEFLNSRINVRTPDIANCLVKEGYFDDLEVACAYLKTIKYPREYLLDVVDVLKTMSKVSAKLVWAHSIYGLKQKKIPFEQVEEFVSELKPYGLMGLECYYSLYNKEEIDNLRNIAKKFDLFITCGSDYHGKNKKVQLTERSADGTVVDENEINIIKTFSKTVN